jgi:phosphoglycerate dehydrogenase-like enzyme
VLPEGVRSWAAEAVVAGGGTVVAPADAEALVWTATGIGPGAGPADLTATLASHPGIRWIQLPWAGVEPYADAGVFDQGHLWTSGKGVYARPVAEHALALALTGLHQMKAFSRATRWTAQAGDDLFDRRVAVFGGGGITEVLLDLLRPFDCRTTVVRRHPTPMSGAARVVGWTEREAVLRDADVVFLALALTPETDGFLGRAQLEAMPAHAWLVNVARGRHVVTDDLVAALRDGVIAGAALDVTEPEPLPEGHPLWELPSCIITPHTANTAEMATPLLSARIAANVGRFAGGEDLIGVVDAALGY